MVYTQIIWGWNPKILITYYLLKEGLTKKDYCSIKFSVYCNLPMASFHHGFSHQNPNFLVKTHSPVLSAHWLINFHTIIVWLSNSIPEHSHEVSQSYSFLNSGYKSVQGDQIFKEPYEIPSNLNRETHPESHKALENIRRKNINRLIFAQFNINSLWNKSEPLQHIINKNIDVLLISETKIDSYFPSVQFYLEGYATPD